MNKRSVISVFEKVANDFAHHVAIHEDELSVTYGLLDKQSGELANKLTSSGVGPGDVVGLALAPGIPYVTSMLAVLKVGGTFLPIPPELPEKRVSQILVSVKPKAVLYEENGFSATFDTGWTTSYHTAQYGDYTLQLNENSGQPLHDATTKIGKETIYLLFTSGSTGNPKGIKGRNESLSHFIHWELKEFATGSRDRVPLLAPISFDVSLRDIFVPLFSGGTILIPPPRKFDDFDLFISWLSRTGITLLHTVPSIFRLIHQSISEGKQVAPYSLKHILLAGEALYWVDIQKWVATVGSEISITNLYGPSESTLAKVAYHVPLDNVKSEGIVPLGQPISNTSVIIANDNQLCDPLEKGQIIIKTPFLSNGYWQLAEEEHGKFVQNPFHDEFEEIVYLTGDYGYFDEEGRICFSGRGDGQLKIEGNRVEISEVESALRLFEKLEQVLVIDYWVQETCSLAVLFTSNEKLTVSGIQDFLSNSLPGYMIPKYCFQTDTIPINTNGKVDRGEARLIIDQFLSTYEVPQESLSATEQTLLDIWRAVLKVEAISKESSFFEIGGTSLKALMILGKIRQKFDVTLGFEELFAHKQLGALANCIDELNASDDVIQPIEEQEYYPVSHAQQRMWVLDSMLEDKSVYYIDKLLSVHDAKEVSAWKSKLKRLIKQFDIFRTYFTNQENELIQVVIPYDDQLVDQAWSWQERTEDTSVKDWLAEQKGIQLSLDQLPLFRIALFQENDQVTVFFRIHHVISDGWSLQILQDVLVANNFPEVSLQYKDYTHWHNQLIQNNIDLEVHWRKRIGEAWPNPKVDHFAPLSPGLPSHAKVDFTFEYESVRFLNQYVNDKGITKFSLWLGLFNLILFKLTGQAKNLFAVPVSGRDHPDLHHQPGCFVNTLPILVDLNGQDTFSSYVKQVDSDFKKDLEKGIYPLDKILAEVGKHITIPDPPFAVSIQYLEDFGDNSPIYWLEPVELSEVDSKFHLSITLFEDEDGLHLGMDYDTSLMTRSDIRRYMDCINEALINLIADPDAKISEIQILPEKDQKLLDSFNQTEEEFEGSKTVTGCFQKQVDQNGFRIALQHNNDQLTYDKLDARTNVVSRVIRNYGARRGDIVAIKCRRSFDLIIGIIGVLKAGCAYLPIDPKTPARRMETMIRDCKSNLLITDEAIELDVEVEVMTFDQQLKEDDQEKGVTIEIDRGDLAYVIFTSGSTGTPKGVLVSHESVVNLIYAQQKNYGVSANERVFQFSNMSFDASVEQMWLALATGATLVLSDETLLLDNEAFNAYLSEQAITHLDVTPSYLESIDLEFQSNLKRIVVGGEACSLNLAHKYFGQYNFYNVYGPTESTITSVVNRVETNDGAVTIGKPISNTHCYILSDSLELLPIGAVGELCIAGKGLSLGYLNDESLTDRKFIDNPFRSGEKLYRTGDLARWHVNGKLEFIGRNDDQVKIRGYRIELREIEATLSTHAEVGQAVVLVKGDKKNPYLVGFYVAPERINKASLEDFLRARLPEYMVPTYFVQIAQLPLTTSGKVDKQALPEHQKFSDDLISPKNSIESALAQIWSEVLGVDKTQIGAHQSFFELGGNSLHAVRIINAIKARYGSKVSLRDIFMYPSIVTLSLHLSQLNLTQPLRRGLEDQDHYPLSRQQASLWKTIQVSGSGVYNVVETYRVEFEIDQPAIEKALTMVLSKHEMLRTVIIDVEGVPRLHLPDSSLQVSVDQVDARALSFEALQGKLAQWSNQPVDLATLPQIRVCIYQQQDHQLIQISMPHVLTDDWSMNLFFDDLLAAHQETHVGGRPDGSYLKYALNQYHQGFEYNNSKAYWLEKFSDFSEVESIGKTVIVGIDEPADQIHFSIDGKFFAEFKRCCRANNARGVMVVMAWLKAYLYKVTGSNNLTIGTTVTSRFDQDLEHVIGYFVNTIAIPSQLGDELSFEKIVAQERDIILEGFDHLDYPYAQLISDSNVKGGLFDILIEYERIHPQDIKTYLPDISSYDVNRQTTKFGLTFFVEEYDDHLEFSVEYALKKFEKSELEGHITRMLELLEGLLFKPEKPLGNLNLIGGLEEQELLSIGKGPIKPVEGSILERIFLQVKEAPDAPAIRFEGNIINYRGLWNRSIEISGQLKSIKNIRSTSIVAIITDRSPGWVIGSLAVMMSGCAYVVISDDLPKNRIDFILEDCKALAVLAANKEVASYSNEGYTVIDLNQQFQGNNWDAERFELPKSQDLAYVLFTSGSSGNPKGVAVTHGSLLNYVNWGNEYYLQGGKGEFGIITSVGFDLSITGMFLPLVSGGTITLFMEDLPYEMVKKLFESDEVFHTKLTPSHLRMAEALGIQHSSLKFIILGGEQVLQEDVSFCHSLGIKVFNEYGPTETTVGITVEELKAEEISIGNPIDNASIYLLNEEGDLTPRYEAGEIFIGGRPLALGYLNQVEKQAQSFIQHPKYGLLYKTGDLGKWLPNNKLAYLGRTDRQVKVNGYRIECGEIENALTRHEQITTAHFTLGQNKEMIAFYVAKNRLKSEQLIGFLSSHLPAFMVPQAFVQVEEMPVTANGKVDEKQLLALLGQGSHAVDADFNAVFLDICQQVLQTEIDLSDNFFDKGGDSLRAVQLITQMKDHLAISLDMNDIFDMPTFEALIDATNNRLLDEVEIII